MDLLAQIIAWINVGTNAFGKFVLGFIGASPGWLSNTIVSGVTGLILLVIFKYTSNQRAIQRVRDDMKAHMLALKLFKDSFTVTLRAQGRIFLGAVLLLVHAIRPMLVMIVPVSLLLAQLGLWYQSRPLRVGEQTVVTMKLNERANSPLPEVRMDPTPAVEVTTGPIRISSRREICWEIRTRENSASNLVFQVDGERVEKEIAIGDGFMRVSAERPDWKWSDIMLNPAEKPFGTDSIVQSISISYPDRESWTSGADWWVVYFFVASIVFALIFKPILKVKI